MAGPYDVYALGGTQLIVPDGATLALRVVPEEFETSSGIKMLSGASLQLFRVPYYSPNAYAAGYTPGTNWAGASLVALNTAGGYVIGTSEAISIDGGQAGYYLMATGGTAIVAKLVGYSSKANGYP